MGFFCFLRGENGRGMGSGNKERKAENTAATANYNAALTTAQTESPYEKRRRETAEAISNWAKSGDYRTPPKEASVFFNFADPAERARQRAVLSNSRGQGVGALGAGANPTLLALNKEHMDAELEADAGREYQDTAARVVGAASGELADLDTADRARRMGVLGVSSGMKQAALSIPKEKSWFEKLMDYGMSGARTAATGGMGG